MKHDNPQYDKQITAALGNIDSSVAFSLLYEDSDGFGWTYAIDDSLYPSKQDVSARHCLLLGHHIRHVVDKFDAETSEVLRMALELSESYEIEGQERGGV
jgi:hypothetical protein